MNTKYHLNFSPGIYNFESQNFTSHSIIISTSRHLFDDLIVEIQSLIKNPDTFELSVVRPKGVLFAIDDLRELQAQLLLRSSKKRLIIVKAIKLPVVTQNAMLKLTEDGAHNSTLIFVIGPSVVLLPTLQSRVLLSQYVSKVSNDSIESDEASDFISQDVVARIAGWDDINDSGNLGMLAVELFGIVKSGGLNLDTKDLKLLLDAYQGWQAGKLAGKYFYELLSLTIPVKG